MANQVSAYPITIDTVSAVSAVSTLFNAVVIRWTSASTADTVVLQDKDGNLKWQSVGKTANHTEESTFPVEHPLTFNGLTVPTLGTGTIIIYTKEKDPV